MDDQPDGPRTDIGRGAGQWNSAHMPCSVAVSYVVVKDDQVITVGHRQAVFCANKPGAAITGELIGDIASHESLEFLIGKQSFAQKFHLNGFRSLPMKSWWIL